MLKDYSYLTFMIADTKTKKISQTLFSQGINVIGRLFGLVSLPVGLVIASTAPVLALEVKFNPSSPRLGDSVSVIVSADNPPASGKITVTSGDESYPAYPIGSNQYRAFIAITPLEKPGRRVVRVTDGVTTRNMAIFVGKRNFRVQRITLPPGKAGTKASELELRRAREFREVRSPEKLWNGAFILPSKARRSTPYGVRRYYNGVFANDYYHRGLDFAGASGSPVVSPAPGRVVLVGRVSQGFRVHGNVVGIDHGQGVGSIMMHLKDISVTEGDVIQAGQKVGTIGTTGASTGPHLHWGLYVNGKSIDPEKWLKTNVE